MEQFGQFGHNGSNALGNDNGTNTVYPVQPMTEYSEIYTGKIAILPKGMMIDGSGLDTIAYIQEDGTIIGSGTQTNGRLLNTRTGIRYGLMELKPDFMELNTRSMSLKQGENADLSVSVRKNLNAYVGHIKLSDKIEWTSSNPKVAEVDQNGKVTAVGLGEAIITATDKVNGYIASGYVYVIQNHEKAVAVPEIEQGVNFTAILKADGTVWTTGLNNNGQLGDGTTTDRSKPVQVKINQNTYLTNVIKISASDDHTIALTKSGTVYAWGLNNVGQLGNGTTTRSLYATPVLNEEASAPVSGIIDVSTAYKRSYMVDSTGTAYSFGYGNHGALAHQSNSNSTLPTKILESENSIKVVGASDGIAVVMNDLSIKTAGYNHYGTVGQNYRITSGTHRGPNLIDYVMDIDQVGKIKGVKKLVSSGHAYVAMTNDNKAYVWGWNSTGEFGNGTTGVSARPIELSIPQNAGDLVDIGASWKNIMVKLRTTKEDGTDAYTVYVSGLNDNAQLGIGNKTNQTSFVQIQDSTGTSTAKGLDILPNNPRATTTTGYIDEAGHVWTVGLNNNGQLGDDTVYQRYNLVVVGEVALKTEELIMDMTINEEKAIKTSILDSFNVYIKETAVGDLEFTSLNTDIATVDSTGKVTAKAIGSALIKVKDKTNNLETAVYVKVTSGKTDMKYTPMVDGGNTFSAALKGDGTVWAWGDGRDGELGNNSTESITEPEQVLGKDGIGYLENIKMIACGDYHMLALKDDGTVWAWGYNNAGQLGDNSQITRYTPVQVLAEGANGYLKDIVYIAAGNSFSAAINKDGEIYTWGYNKNGQLGDGSTVNKFTPVRVKANLTGIIKIDCGVNHMVAQKADGTVYTWGLNNLGKLGDGSTVQRAIPVQMLLNGDEYISDAIDVAVTTNNTYALRADGSIIAVGAGANGALGNDNGANSTIPVEVLEYITNDDGTDGTRKLTNIIEIEGGANTMYALTKDGHVYSWGLGTSGELGNNQTGNYFAATKVLNGVADADLSDILYIGAGANHALVVENHGYVQTFGLNNWDQLGIAGIDKSSLPVYIGSNAVAVPNDVKMHAGETQKITVNMSSFNLFKSDDDLTREFTFRSINDSIATVSSDGTITGVSNGITKVLATEKLSRKSCNSRSKYIRTRSNSNT